MSWLNGRNGRSRSACAREGDWGAGVEPRVSSAWRLHGGGCCARLRPTGEEDPDERRRAAATRTRSRQQADCPSEDRPGAPGDVKELRLGLVCYGGVSLAIYMHGITKEIHRAVRASVMEERGEASKPDAASELAYRELLQALRADRDVHTRIVVDAIAGSSAGGINGIFLGKGAVAHDLDQDALRDLWFEYGDLGKIVHEPEGVARLVERLAARVDARGRGRCPE